MILKAITLMLICISTSYAAGDAVFGLKWLMSPQQVETTGISLNILDADEHRTRYSTKKLPNGHTLADSYILVFYQDSLLVQIQMFSKDITEDLYGIEGKRIYQAMYDQLAQKYALDGKTLYTGRKLYEENDEFYQCLKYTGCGNWITFFRHPNKIMYLELIGTAPGEGYIVFLAEASEYDLIRKSREMSDKKAF